METRSSFHEIELLKNPDQYPLWKIRMSDLLTAKRAAWVDQFDWEDLKLAHIRLNVGLNYLALLRYAKTGSEAFQILENLLGMSKEEKRRKSKILFANMILLKHRPEMEDVKDHLLAMQSYRAEINSYGYKHVDDASYVQILIGSLPDSWEEDKVALERFAKDDPRKAERVVLYLQVRKRYPEDDDAEGDAVAR